MVDYRFGGIPGSFGLEVGFNLGNPGEAAVGGILGLIGIIASVIGTGTPLGLSAET